ncbi:hypothetical protein KKE68_01780 [Patescibacteria group bacterium]|nr:hypothetical protein [Patescibacteria group bacterium]
MKFVEIYKTQNDGSQQIITVCELVDQKVVCEGDKVFVENLEREGIFDYSTPGKKLFPKDGIGFLEGLKFTFKSGYLNASEVKEK